MPYRILIKCRMIINLFDCFLHNANFCFARDIALYLLFIIGLKLYECKIFTSRTWMAFEKDLNIAWKTIYSITVICHINATLQSGMICKIVFEIVLHTSCSKDILILYYKYYVVPYFWWNTKTNFAFNQLNLLA